MSTFYPFIVYCRGRHGSYRGIRPCTNEVSARKVAANFTEKTFAQSTIATTKTSIFVDVYRFQRCDDCGYLNACSTRGAYSQGVCVPCWQQREKEAAEYFDKREHDYLDGITEELHAT